MPILRQLIAHAVIATTTVGGVACFCPADVAHAASELAPAAVHAGHAHATDADGGADGSPHAAGCAHDVCGSACTVVSATSAKSQAKVPGKDAPQLDEVALALFVPGGWPVAPPPTAAYIPRSSSSWLSPDSPVRRFDRLLD